MRFALGAAALLLLPGGLCAGAVRYYDSRHDLAAAAEQRRNFVPNVRVAAVRASGENNKGAEAARAALASATIKPHAK